MKSQHRINNTRFSVALCSIAQQYGFTTVGAMVKALKRANPNAKWSFYNTHVRGSRLLKELEHYCAEM